MHVENVTVEVLKGLPDGEVRDLRHRFILLYAGNYAKDPRATVGGLSESEFVDRYVLLRHEMEHRDMRIMTETALDRLVKGAMVRKATWGGLDVPSLGDVTVAESYVSIGGPFVRDPGGSADLGIIIRDAEENRDKELELRLGRLLSRETRKACSFIYVPQGPQSTFLPVFDLVLRARPGNRIEEVSEVSDVLKALSPADQKACDEETARIRESRKKADASRPHKFQPARFTHPNGHPRCLVCGDEESVGGICNKTLPPAEAERQFDHWYETGEWLKKIAAAGDEGRAALIEEARRLGIELDKGGEGSGNFGHGGRPGEVGGSGEGGEGNGGEGNDEEENGGGATVSDSDAGKNADRVASRLSEGEVADIWNYTADPSVNSTLRLGQTPKYAEAREMEALDKAFRGGPVTDNPTDFHRAVDEDFFPEVGATFVDKAFVSTSRNQEGFATVKNQMSGGGISENPIHVIIRAPKGQSYLPMARRLGNPEYHGQKEAILPRNTKFKVVSKSAEKITLRIVK